MAIGTISSFTLYDEQFYAGWSEVIEQNVNIFNEASAGTILLSSRNLKGQYEKSTYHPIVASLVTRRDPTSVSAATDLSLATGEIVRVKLNRKIGPLAQTLDSLRKLGANDETASFVLGQQVGGAVAADYLAAALGAGRAAIKQQASCYLSATSGTLTHSVLVDGLKKFGDASNRIRAFVMHSKNYFDLVKQAIADKITEVAGVTIYQGTVGTFNRPVIVTDDATLVDLGATPDEYFILGLTEGAIVMEESEGRTMVAQTITGLENIVVRLQGEYAFNIGLKGFTWDVGNGGANPQSAALVTGTNWDLVASDIKSTAGICIGVQ